MEQTILLQVRIHHAKAQLAQGQEIADVAIDTGFADQSHFTRHFKRFVGVTPGKFIDQAFEELGVDSVITLLPTSRTRVAGMRRLGFYEDGEVTIEGEVFNITGSPETQTSSRTTGQATRRLTSDC